MVFDLDSSSLLDHVVWRLSQRYMLSGRFVHAFFLADGWLYLLQTAKLNYFLLLCYTWKHIAFTKTKRRPYLLIMTSVSHNYEIREWWQKNLSISWLQDPYHEIVSHSLLGKCKQLSLGAEWGWIINQEWLSWGPESSRIPLYQLVGDS